MNDSVRAGKVLVACCVPVGTEVAVELQAHKVIINRVEKTKFFLIGKSISLSRIVYPNDNEIKNVYDEINIPVFGTGIISMPPCT